MLQRSADNDQLQAVAMNKGYRWKKTLFSEQGRSQLEKLWLAPWASRRWKELLELLDQLDAKIAELTAAVEQEANQRPEVLRLMTHPGVGPVTGLAYVQVLGTPDRFPCGKQIGSHIGLIPCEDSSAGRQRLGHLSKQGHALLRYLLGEAAQAAVRCNPHWRRRYMHVGFHAPVATRCSLKYTNPGRSISGYRLGRSYGTSTAQATIFQSVFSLFHNNKRPGECSSPKFKRLADK